MIEFPKKRLFKGAKAMTKGEDLAFPFKNPANDEGHSGLLKREYFAALLMQGILSNEELRIKIRQDRETPEQVAVQMSDALIEALNKKENEE